MIPEDFRDFFISSDSLVQQQIVSSLLALSTERVELVDDNEQKGLSSKKDMF